MNCLIDIGLRWRMRKIMLTVLRGMLVIPAWLPVGLTNIEQKTKRQWHFTRGMGMNLYAL